MATRRNVPSKDAFRAIKTAQTTLTLNRKIHTRSVSHSLQPRSYRTKTYSTTRCSTPGPLLPSAFFNLSAHPTLESRVVSFSSSITCAHRVRAFSLSRDLADSAVAPLSDDLQSSDNQYGAEYSLIRPRLLVQNFQSSKEDLKSKRRHAKPRQGSRIEVSNTRSSTKPVESEISGAQHQKDPRVSIKRIPISREYVPRSIRSTKHERQSRLQGSSIRISRVHVDSKRRYVDCDKQSRETAFLESRTSLHSFDVESASRIMMPEDPSASILYLAPNESIPVYKPHRAVYYKERMSRTSDPRYGYLYSRILHVRDSHDHLVALQLAASILRSYISTKLDSDAQLARQLYIGLCYRFSPDDVRLLRNNFVRTMLQECPPRLEVVSLLLEPTELESPITAKYIRSYLADFCREVTGPDLQMAEAEKVLQGIPKSASALRDAVLLPLVRSALNAKNPDRARAIILKLSEKHGLSPDFHVLADLMRVYARAGDWSATDALLEELHHRGYSRSKPYAFAALVRTIYHHFADVRHPTRMFDFLTYSMQNQGLVPTTMLSISVIKDFIAFRRYDLVQRFIHARQTWFPNILSPLDTPLAAYEIAEAWTHSGASPSDVFFTCKALAYGTVRDPFFEEFRHMTNAYLLRLVNKSLRLFTKQTGIEERLSFRSPSSLKTIFEYIDQIGDLVSSKRLDLRTSLLFDTFRKQVEAAHDVEFLVNHFPGYIQQRGMVPKIDPDQIPAKKLPKRIVYAPDLPEDILSLPGSELAKAVTDLYQDAKNHNEVRDKRDVVVVVMRYLQQNQRYRDCAILVRQLWNSGSLEGQFFIHEVIKCWIRSAFELRDPKTLHEALWATVDAEDTHITGYRLLILIRAATAVITEEVRLGRLKQYPNQLEELKYLVSRCYRRRWQQDGCQEAKDIADPFLKRWKLEQDSLKQNTPVLIRPAYVF